MSLQENAVKIIGWNIWIKDTRSENPRNSFKYNPGNEKYPKKKTTEEIEGAIFNSSESDSSILRWFFNVNRDMWNF